MTKRSVLLPSIYASIGLSQETERPKGNAKPSQLLEKVYLVLPFSYILLRFEAETNLFASLCTSHTLSNISSQSSNTQVQTLMIAKALLYHLKIFVWKSHTQKEILNEICKICSNILLEYGTFGMNLCELFPDLHIQHLKIGQETSKLGGMHEPFSL